MSERCSWAGPDQLYIDYHDNEWGVPERDGRALFECLSLEAFQAGLSWITILKRRETFRAAFQGFDPDIIADWGKQEVARLLLNEGIVRHRGKIEATIGNAKAWQRIEAEQGFAAYLWRYVDHAPLQPDRAVFADVPAATDLSKQLSKDLKKNGFKFCGPTIVYAFMQAVGMVNDHLVTCPRHGPVKKMGETVSRIQAPQP